MWQSTNNRGHKEYDKTTKNADHEEYDIFPTKIA